MDRLPPEILRCFFLALLPIPSRHLTGFHRPACKRSRDITTLRLVSRIWNENILDTPELWSYITVSVRGTDALRYLARSKAAPLHVRLLVFPWTPGISPEKIRAAVEALWREADRWTTYHAYTSRTGHGGTYSWFRLIPPFPIPRLREIRLAGDQAANFQCPELKRLHQWGCYTNIHLGVAPALRIWVTKRPANHKEWEQLLLASQHCPLLESLKLTEYPHDEMTESQLKEPFLTTNVARPTFLSLKELMIVSSRVAFDLITYLNTPALSLLIIGQYTAPIPFTIPPSRTALNRIRFVHSSELCAIKETLSRFSPASLQGLAVEIENDGPLRRFAARDEEVGRQVRWLDEHVLFRLFDIPDWKRISYCCSREHPE